jgi:hypothetical protein
MSTFTKIKLFALLAGGVIGIALIVCVPIGLLIYAVATAPPGVFGGPCSCHGSGRTVFRTR